MALPSVDIELTNGSLGGVPISNDGVAGMVLSGVAIPGDQENDPPKVVLGEVYTVFSLDDVRQKGITAEYDSTYDTDAYKHCKDFYMQAGDGAELWLMIVGNTNLMSVIADEKENFASKLLQKAEGKIRLLGITRNPPDGYTNIENEIDKDVKDAVLNAQVLADAQALNPLYRPVSILIEGRDFQGDTGFLWNFREGTQNRVSVVIGNDNNSNGAFVGMVLGKMAANPVQRNIGRVKDGDLGITNAYLSSGKAIKDCNFGELGALHDKGYIFARKYTGRNGFYFNDDPTCSLPTDDYGSQANRRVIDKAVRLLYQVYLNELLDDISMDPETGKMSPGVIKSYQAAGERVITDVMLANDEISGIDVFVDPDQNVLANKTVQVNLGIIPKGYAKEIKVVLGFQNPQNA